MFVRGFRVWDLPDGTQYRVENEKLSFWAGIESKMIPVYGNSYVYKLKQIMQKYKINLLK